MNFVHSLILISFCVLALNKPSISAPLIIGGRIDNSANNNGVIQLAMTLSDVKIGACTATKISKNFIITAAHCFRGKNIQGLGFSTLTENLNMAFAPIEFEQVFMHPKFSEMSDEEAKQMDSYLINPDIALVKVKPNLDFDKLSIIELDYDITNINQKVEIWGYGCQKSIYNIDDYTPIRQIGKSITLDKKELLANHNLMSKYYAYYSDAIYEYNVLTAGNKKDASLSSLCLGDSGGPLILNGRLIGINSYYTFSDIDPNDPNGGGEGISYVNLHARISKVKAWIQKTLKKYSQYKSENCQ